MTDNKSVRMALIGCGGLGRRHALNMKVIPGLELVAVCDATRGVCSGLGN